VNFLPVIHFLNEFYVIYLVDVCTADDDVDVVDDHHLGVDVDWESKRLAKRFGHWFSGGFESVQMFTGKFAFAWNNIEFIMSK